MEVTDNIQVGDEVWWWSVYSRERQRGVVRGLYTADDDASDRVARLYRGEGALMEWLPVRELRLIAGGKA